MQLNSSVATRSAARGLILGVIWVGALAGCGQKGPLTLPSAAARKSPAASAPAATPVPAAASAASR